MPAPILLDTSPLKANSPILYDTYGPNDSREKLINLLGWAAKRKATLLHSPGEQLADLVYINDVVSAYLIVDQQMCAMPQSLHRRYAISSRVPVTRRQLVALYQEVIGTEPLRSRTQDT
jgi:nucleoside-diphosphate-sugar epimerase